MQLSLGTGGFALQGIGFVEFDTVGFALQGIGFVEFDNENQATVALNGLQASHNPAP